MHRKYSITIIIMNIIKMFMNDIMVYTGSLYRQTPYSNHAVLANQLNLQPFSNHFRRPENARTFSVKYYTCVLQYNIPIVKVLATMTKTAIFFAYPLGFLQGLPFEVLKTCFGRRQSLFCRIEPTIASHGSLLLWAP